MKLLLFCFTTVFFNHENVYGQSPTVTTTKGRVFGYTYMNASIFQGIPYAKPPLGNLRFMAPTPPQSWSTPMNTTQFSSWCMQKVQKDHPDAVMSEDCLYLNVFSPNVLPTTKFPVMFWIHGGAFTVGSAAQYPMDGIVQNLVSRGVVVVTINYRLNIFGFYTTAPSHCVAGNVGLMDQILALKWVQTEIAAFGGDPNRVTIFGESAGSASVSLLTYSPLAKGLFSQAIMESGTAYNSWAINGNMDYYYPSSRGTTVNLNCTNNTQWNRNWNSCADLNLVSCMQNVSSTTLLTYALKHYSNNLIASELSWGPVIDGYVLPDWPRNLASNRNNVPIMLGNNKDETALFIIDQLWSKTLNIDGINEQFFEFIVNQTFIDPGQFGLHSGTVQNILFYNYILNGPIIQNSNHLGWAKKVADLTSDYTFFAGTATEASTWLNNGNNQVYLYSLDYESDTFPYPANYSCSFHSFELFFLFKTMFQHFKNYPTWTMSPTDLQISDTIGTLWTNFAKTGNPGMGWQPLNGFSLAGISQYLSINKPSPKMMSYYQYRGVNLWNFLIPRIIGSIAPTLPPPATTTSMNTPMPMTSPATSVFNTTAISAAQHTTTTTTTSTTQHSWPGYTLQILIEYFDNTAGGGMLYNSAQHCDPFWFAGVDQCDIAMKICIEPYQASPNMQICSTAWVDLGQVTTNKNNAIFTTGLYGGWTNPMIYTLSAPVWKGFQTKLIVQDVDNGGRQLIDQSLCQFPGANNGGKDRGVTGCKHSRPSGYSTYFQVAYQKI